jgi:type III restriction enzyme
VLGISATPERFDDEMAAAAPERVPRRVSVPIEQVKESGLIKDVLSIQHKGEAETMEMTLVREAVRNLKAIDTAWDKYTAKEDEPPVRPAMVIQIAPDSEGGVGAILDVCKDEWPILEGAAIAHSLQSHAAEEFGSHTVHYVQPQDIQDHPTIRVIVFKEALTTGWDCPRAEVLLSLRRAVDDTYIAQLIGRMVRSPLARRIESNEALNRVLLYLPQFDDDAVQSVKEKLETDPEGPPSEIVVNAIDAPRNKNVPKRLFSIVEQLPSYVVPGPVHRSQVTRLHRLAALLVGDGLLANAIGASNDFLIGVIEGERKRLEADGSLAARVADAATATYVITEVSLYSDEEPTAGQTMDLVSEIGDVDRMFRAASRKFKDGLADTYWGYRVTSHGDDSYDAKILTIALSNDSDVPTKVELEAEGRVGQWLSSYGDNISMLSEDRKAKYAEIRAMARTPEIVAPGLPQAITMPSDPNVPGYKKHLFSDSKGLFRAAGGEWEQYVLTVEVARPGFVGWYRNPTGGQRALRIPFKRSGDDYGKLYPDFVFFHKDESGDVRPSIVDPHGHHLSDAGPKLRGLATYAEQHEECYQRIVGVIKTKGGDFRMLDVTDPTIREALGGVVTKEDIEAVFVAQGANYT